MQVLHIDFYLDGGSALIRTDEGDFYLDNRMGTKTPNILYNKYPDENVFVKYEPYDDTASVDDVSSKDEPAAKKGGGKKKKKPVWEE